MHDWIVINFGKEPNQLECKRCGATQPYLLPMAVDVYVAMSKAFAKLHKHCKERKGEDRGRSM